MAGQSTRNNHSLLSRLLLDLLPTTLSESRFIGVYNVFTLPLLLFSEVGGWGGELASGKRQRRISAVPSSRLSFLTLSSRTAGVVVSSRDPEEEGGEGGALLGGTLWHDFAWMVDRGLLVEVISVWWAAVTEEEEVLVR